MKWRGLIQLVLVLVIIVTLIGLFMPTVQRGHDYGGRTQTNNNLKQCALAVHNYHDTYRKLPDAFSKGGIFVNEEKSWLIRLTRMLFHEPPRS